MQQQQEAHSNTVRFIDDLKSIQDQVEVLKLSSDSLNLTLLTFLLEMVLLEVKQVQQETLLAEIGWTPCESEDDQTFPI